MSTKNFSVATLSGIFAVLAGFIILAGCGGGSGGGGTTTTTTGTPAASVSPTSLTFSSGVSIASAPQTVTITNTGTATLTFSGFTSSNTVFAETNNCSSTLGQGSFCTVIVIFTPTASGTASGTLSISDSASGSPQMVTLSGTGSSGSAAPTSLSFTGVTVGTTSTAQTVTLTNTGSTAMSVTSITATTGFNETNTCGSSVAANSHCAINVTYSATSSSAVQGTLTIVDGAGTQTVTLAGSSSVTNTVPVSVNFGPNGQSGGFLNIVYVNVTVCQPGTTTCVTIPNVQVDTGSSGLRIMSSALTGVNLAQLNDGGGDNLGECTEYADGEFNWGPVVLATVQVGGETASQVPAAAGGTANSGIPIQIISNETVPKAVQAEGQCVTTASTPDQDTVAAFGANGILGVSGDPQDCSFGGVNYCDNSADAQALANNGKLYYWYCTAAGACGQEVVPLTQQVWNPVATFSSTDTNGVLLTLPSVTAAGAVSVNGTLTFGIGTESNNALPGGATVYARDQYGFFPETTFNGVNYFDVNSGGTAYLNPAYLDSGSEVYFFSDPTTLTSATGVSTVNCTTGTADGLYCPVSTLNFNFTVFGSNSTTGTLNLSIANAQSELTTNPSFAVFDNLGATSGTDPSSDSFDVGLPFFFGRTIAVGIAGATTGSPINAFGYWAF